jgi:chromosome segregation protein
MDKGAHFYKCDFQVHTPRDPNWTGADATSDADRKAYADELILASRQKGLGAIAITDHHDFAFFPYIKKAALDELDDQGRPVSADDRIVVFPGMELTLTAPNCQALLILDAEFPENLLQSVLTALSISQAPPTDTKNFQVTRIPQNVVSDLADLYEKLNSHAHLRGHFIVFPNVSEGGNCTLLRSGFANFYKSMPCVGGYTDGAISQYGKGNLAIVSGQNRDYGFKSIGLFQTSDNRRRDHTDLGKFTTWVKWSEPTAEALRQACLAKESRLSQTEPTLPNLWIVSISVSNSKFLGRIEAEFNQQDNAIIGGRGTGKSTLLEYLRWGLCDQPVDNTGSDIAPVQMRRKKLIDDTLLKLDGEVIVTFLLNGVQHIVKRNSKTQEIFLRIGGGQFSQVTEQQVRNIFPVQAYSQKQLSSLGVRVEELKRFVELPIKQALDKIRFDIRSTEAGLRSAYSNLIRQREIEAEIKKYDLEITSQTEQVTTLRGALKGLSDTDQETIGKKVLYDNEEGIIQGLEDELYRVKELVDSLQAGVPEEQKEEGTQPEIDNTDIIKEIQAAYAAKLQEVRDLVVRLSALFAEESLKSVLDAVARWDTAKQGFDAKYQAAKERATSNQQQLTQIQDAEKRIADLKKQQAASRIALRDLADPASVYAGLRSTWNTLPVQKVNALDAQCKAFSSLSDGLIMAEIRDSLDIDGLKQRMKTTFAGLNIREQKIDDLCQLIIRAIDPIAEWNSILAELEALALHNAAGADPLPPTPKIDSCGFIQNEKGRLVAGMTPAKWLELSVTELEFNPIFRYCTNKDTHEYIDFADASAGQQATALFTVLLNQPGASLIIDQPEDDVDSKMSQEIVRKMWTAKTRRQFIFASHNANLVVNGDAELVICCDYIKSGDQTGGQIKAVGAIDSPSIKDEITSVTEGGKEAFKLRKEKYGF